jgi:hypothetical protein
VSESVVRNGRLQHGYVKRPSCATRASAYSFISERVLHAATELDAGVIGHDFAAAHGRQEFGGDDRGPSTSRKARSVWGSQSRLRSAAVFVDESVEQVVSFEVAYGGERAVVTERRWWDELQRAVRPVGVVVIDVDAEHMLEMAAVHDEEPIEAFSADGADEALGNRVRVWCSHWRLDDADAFAGEHGVKVARELAVSIADQETERRGLLPKSPGELSSLLSDPCPGWVGGATGENAAASETR